MYFKEVNFIKSLFRKESVGKTRWRAGFVLVGVVYQ